MPRSTDAKPGRKPGTLLEGAFPGRNPGTLLEGAFPGGNREPFWRVHFRAETGKPYGRCISGRNPGSPMEGAFPV